eukprot:1699608-Rhodomonas_salina.4
MSAKTPPKQPPLKLHVSSPQTISLDSMLAAYACPTSQTDVGGAGLSPRLTISIGTDKHIFLVSDRTGLTVSRIFGEALNQFGIAGEEAVVQVSSLDLALDPRQVILCQSVIDSDNVKVLRWDRVAP